MSETRHPARSLGLDLDRGAAAREDAHSLGAVLAH